MQSAVKLIGLALIYALAFVLVEVFAGMHPYAWTYSAVPAALIAAWPYFKLCERYPLPGIAMLCAILLLMVNFLIGQGHEIFAIGCLVLGFIAEGFRKLWGNYRGRKGTIASYAVLSLMPFTKTCVWWIDFDIAKEMNIPNYLDVYYATHGRMLNFDILATMIVVTLVLAVGIMWFFTRNWNPREQYHVIIED